VWQVCRENGQVPDLQRSVHNQMVCPDHCLKAARATGVEKKSRQGVLQNKNETYWRAENTSVLEIWVIKLNPGYF